MKGIKVQEVTRDKVLELISRITGRPVDELTGTIRIQGDHLGSIMDHIAVIYGKTVTREVPGMTIKQILDQAGV